MLDRDYAFCIQKGGDMEGEYESTKFREKISACRIFTENM